jgi:hypothetical protein
MQDVARAIRGEVEALARLESLTAGKPFHGVICSTTPTGSRRV